MTTDDEQASEFPSDEMIGALIRGGWARKPWYARAWANVRYHVGNVLHR